MIQKLQDFLIDETLNLEKVKVLTNQPTFLQIFGITHRELQHSNFLAWLFDSNGSHKVGDYFLRGFINLFKNTTHTQKIELNLADLKRSKILREKDNIDLLILNDDANFLICIENKVWAGLTGQDQLKRYQELIEAKYPSYNHFFIYLTPFPRIIPNEVESNYENLTYTEVSGLISELMQLGTISSEYISLISDYNKTLKKYILMQGEEIILAQKIYQKHKDAIDFIVKHKPNFNTIFNQIDDFFIKSDRYSNLTPNNSIIRILPKEVESKFEYPFNSWGPINRMFAIEFFCSENIITIKFCFGGIYAENEQKRQEFQEIKNDLFLKMKSFDSLNGIITKSKPSSNYPAIAYYTLVDDRDIKLFEDVSLFDLFTQKFEEFENKILNKWIEEVKVKL
jgi:hypothetical protein